MAAAPNANCPKIADQSVRPLSSVVLSTTSGTTTVSPGFILNFSKPPRAAFDLRPTTEPSARMMNGMPAIAAPCNPAGQLQVILGFA